MELREPKYGTGKLPYLEALTDSGELVGWFASQPVARSKLREQRPQPGERVAVRYLGEHETAGYKRFAPEVDRPLEARRVDWDEVEGTPEDDGDAF